MVASEKELHLVDSLFFMSILVSSLQEVMRNAEESELRAFLQALSCASHARFDPLIFSSNSLNLINFILGLEEFVRWMNYALGVSCREQFHLLNTDIRWTPRYYNQAAHDLAFRKLNKRVN